MTLAPDIPLMPGQLLARGVCRHLASHAFATVEEFTPDRGKRMRVAPQPVPVTVPAKTPRRRVL